MAESTRGAGEPSDTRDEQRESSGGGTSAWEWIIAAVGALLVLGAVAVLLREAFTVPPRAPRIEVVADSVVAATGGYLVEITVRNHGTRTAAHLIVEGALRSDTGVVERAQATLDYVPPRALRHAGVFFESDPRRFRLELAARGYARP